MNANEKQFVKTVVDLKSNVIKAQKYIKENFNIDSEFDEDNFTITLSGDITEHENKTDLSVNIVKAENYIISVLDDLITIKTE